MKIICDKQEVLDFIGNKDQFEYDGFDFTVIRPIPKKKRFITNIVTTDESCKGKIVYFDGVRTSKHDIAKKLKMSVQSLYYVLNGKKSFDINGHKIDVR